MMDPAHRHDRMADMKEIYRVTLRFRDSDLRARAEGDWDEVDDRKEEVSLWFARSGVRAVAII